MNDNNDSLIGIAEFQVEKLKVVVFPDRQSLGEAAAKLMADRIKQVLKDKDEVNIIFAAAPSQNEFLSEFTKDASIPWWQINAFHMDEYLGLPNNSAQLFSSFLRTRLFDLRPFKSVHLIDGQATNLNMECTRYADLLRDLPPDIVCMGIGENTHIAFNDPGQADFNDPQWVKVVTLDQECRQQQVNDRCFPQIGDVPRSALTLTIPVLTNAPFICCIVPGKTKAIAIAHTLSEEISNQYPSTILRRKDGAVLLADTESMHLYAPSHE